MSLRIINNLGTSKTELRAGEYQTISDLIINALQYGNQTEPSYTAGQLELLISYMAPEEIKRKTRNGYLVLYEEEGRINGIGCLTPSKKLGWQMILVYVDPARQGGGIGKQIVGELLKQAGELDAEINRIYTTSFPSTMRFYEKWEYHHIETIEWNDPTTGITVPVPIMEKQTLSVT